MVPALPPLFRIPRELRDTIYEYVALGEDSYHDNDDQHAPPRKETPYRLVLHAGGGKSIVCIAARNGLTRTCSKLRQEYLGMVEQLAMAPFFSTPSSTWWIETCNAIGVSVYNCNFEGLIAYLRSLTPQRLALFADERKLRVKIVFTSMSSTKRASILVWLDACAELGVKATYIVPATEHTKYMMLYDLPGKRPAGHHSEEEKLFEAMSLAISEGVYCRNAIEGRER